MDGMTNRAVNRIAVLVTLAVLAFWVWVAFVSFRANAHEPGTDPDAAWFRSLNSGAGVNCCDARDCHRTEAWSTTKAGLYKVMIGKEWVTVQPESVLRVNNPTGMAVECHHTDASGFEVPSVRCFVPPVGV
jgi:hypothetical protein